MNRSVSSIEGMFYGCSSLTEVPEGIFDLDAFNGCSEMTYLFSSCSKLKILPKRLLSRLTRVASAYYSFSYCSQLKSIPYDLLAYSPNLSNISYLFYSNLSIALNPGMRLIVASKIITSYSMCFPSSFNLETICVPANSSTYASMVSHKASYPNSIRNISTIDFECSRLFEFTVDTEGAGAGERRASFPFIPVSDCSIEIDWGDGTAAALSSADLADDSKTVHEYAVPGVYSIVCTASDWSALRLAAGSESDSSAKTVLFRSTLASIESQMPRLANENLNQLFKGCTSLTSMNGTLLDLWNDCTEAVSCFEGCTSMQEIPAGLLAELSSLEDAARMFAGTGIAYIPSGLFGQCSNLQDVTEAFDGCSSLGGISEALFLANPNLEALDNAFRGTLDANPSFSTKEDFEASGTYVELCRISTIAGIPFCVSTNEGSLTVDWGDGTVAELTKSSINNSNLAVCRHQYSNPGVYYITVHSDDWSEVSAMTNQDGTTAAASWYASSIYYRQNTLVKVFTRLPAFSGMRFYSGAYSTFSSASNSVARLYCSCSNLTDIPENLFELLPNTANFFRCFAACGKLGEIPAALFAGNASADTFQYCFAGCTSAAGIPAGLFDACTLTTDFSCCFYNCSSINSIPSGLFANCPNVTTFASCFYGCSKLAAVPSGLFNANTLVTTFASCFYGCSSLASIPEGLFVSCPDVTTFASCFYGCSKIISIPEELFIANVLATSFSQCFRNCSKLASVPEGLFSANTEVTTFGGLFWSCSLLRTVPENLFRYNTKVTGDGFGALFTSSGITTFPENLLTYTDKLTIMYYSSYGIFENASSLGDFTIRFTSRNISGINWFCTKKSGTTRTVYVPSGSTTESTFNASASAFGLTIIGE